MRKIPTVFQRVDGRGPVVDEVTPGCEWVFAGEGVATRKWDGTCVACQADGSWWARREVKLGRPDPRGWVQVDADPVTGKRIGWEPVAQSPFVKFHAEAAAKAEQWSPGTYELIGPKINGNPEGSVEEHMLIPHGADVVRCPAVLGFVDLRMYLRHERDTYAMEGVVWWHPDGRRAKLKAKDFA